MKLRSIALAACLLVCPAFAGDAISSLASRWPFEVAAAPEFRRLAGESLAKKLEPLLETGPKSEVLGGRWVVSEGCRSHTCDTAAAFVVVDSQTGGVWAWTTTSGKAGVTAIKNSTAAGMEPPPEVTTKLDGWRSRLSAGRRGPDVEVEARYKPR